MIREPLRLGRAGRSRPFSEISRAFAHCLRMCGSVFSRTVYPKRLLPYFSPWRRGADGLRLKPEAMLRFGPVRHERRFWQHPHCWRTMPWTVQMALIMFTNNGTGAASRPKTGLCTQDRPGMNARIVAGERRATPPPDRDPSHSMK